MKISTAPDLDYSSPWTLLAIGLVLWIIAAVMWRHERIQQRRAEAEEIRLAVSAGMVGSGGRSGGPARSGDGPDSARSVDRESAAAAEGSELRAVRPEHDRLLALHELTDDEVVALARWFAIGKATPPHLERAVDKLNRRAADILNADRASRR